eukprot:1618909-Pyramimonas_sp.AAC.1
MESRRGRRLVVGFWREPESAEPTSEWLHASCWVRIATTSIVRLSSIAKSTATQGASCLWR